MVLNLGRVLPATKMFLLSVLVSLFLTTEGQVNPPVFTCQSSISHSDPCQQLGSAIQPAYSCQQLKDACDKPSGDYYIQNGLFTKVYCEMQLFGGGWARYGEGDMADEWNYSDEDETEVTLEVISLSEMKEMINLKYNHFRVGTDIFFKLQADDSNNPSRVRTRSMPWLEELDVYIPGYGNDHTRIQFVEGQGDRITCFAGSSSKCGSGGTPAAGETSDRFFVESLYFGPRADGASLPSGHSGQWHRNRYSWSGSYYYVYAK